MRAPMMKSSIISMHRHVDFRKAVAANLAGDDKAVEDYCKKIAKDCQFAKDNVLLVVKAGYSL